MAARRASGRKGWRQEGISGVRGGGGKVRREERMAAGTYGGNPRLPKEIGMLGVVLQQKTKQFWISFVCPTNIQIVLRVEGGGE
jgi:hypothetical protein